MSQKKYLAVQTDKENTILLMADANEIQISATGNALKMAKALENGQVGATKIGTTMSKFPALTPTTDKLLQVTQEEDTH